MESDLQILWGCLLFDKLNITKLKRVLSDDQIREALEKYKANILKIKELDLSCLPIKGLVKELSYFESLETLNLSNCDLETLSSAIQSLKSLKAINFRGNKLEDLSELASNLNTQSLQSIDLSNNAFSVLPDSFLIKFDATEKALPLHINLSGNIWHESDEVLKNMAIKNNWVIQIGDYYF